MNFFLKVFCLVLKIGAIESITCVKDLNDLEAQLEQSCGILVLKGDLDSVDDRIKNNLRDVSRASSNSLPIFCAGNMKSLSLVNISLTFSSPNDNKSPEYIILLEKKLPDRTCLLKPMYTIRNFKAHVYSGPWISDILLDRVNHVCGTYYSMNGEINSEGLTRNKILNSLFSVKNMSGSLSMHDLGTVCSDVRSFFYSGMCASWLYCSPAGTQFRKHYSSQPLSPSAAFTQRIKNFQLPKCESLRYIPTEQEFMSRFLFQSKPVIFKNVVQQWPAFSKWSNRFFRRVIKDEGVHIKVSPSLDFEGIEPINLWLEQGAEFDIPDDVRKNLIVDDLVVVRPAGVEMSMNEFIDMIEKNSTEADLNGVHAYLEYSSLGGISESLLSDVEELSVAKLLNLETTNMWLSSGNTLGKLHFDEYENFLAQMSGKKQFTVFEPSDNRRFYEGHIIEAMFSRKDNSFVRSGGLQESTAMTMSPVDIVTPDFERFPLFRETYPLNCTVEAGDVLYLPAFWWHEVQSYPSATENRNLAVNFWYKPFLTKEFPCADCPLDVNPKYRHLLMSSDSS